MVTKVISWVVFLFNWWKVGTGVKTESDVLVIRSVELELEYHMFWMRSSCNSVAAHEVLYRSIKGCGFDDLVAHLMEYCTNILKVVCRMVCCSVAEGSDQIIKGFRFDGLVAQMVECWTKILKIAG